MDINQAKELEELRAYVAQIFNNEGPIHLCAHLGKHGLQGAKAVYLHKYLSKAFEHNLHLEPYYSLNRILENAADNPNPLEDSNEPRENPI